jgi:hypothetical protein
MKKLAVRQTPVDKLWREATEFCRKSWRLFEQNQQVAGAATTAPLFTTLAAPRRVPPPYPPVFFAHLLTNVPTMDKNVLVSV